MTRNATLDVRIWRGGANGAYTRYDVPRQPSQTVLDVVTWVQRTIEPGLSYRFSCRVGMCGTCAMTVNGVPRWTCRTHVANVAADGVLQIAPLENFPIVRDLAVDMQGFFDKWARAKGRFEAGSTRYDDFARVTPQSSQRVAASAGIECIGCGICYAACDVVRWRADFLGPAALNRAWTLVNDVRDTGSHERMAAVAGDAGAHACHTQGSCTERCPRALEPTAGIAALKRMTARLAMRGEL
ncbi:MAG TPA: succinate dehydrogenase/fumarate reductase iron-sulfur subunit [Casimicrobiaceae bacterium]|nr:succinate dehydrogenase/fumarate reductase iron-sulfur subunit [Casimicrobiaceae bacterium]